jgi:hypothetical protein
MLFYLLLIENTMPDWDRFEKPPVDVCPQAYCFHWLSAGDWFAPGYYESREVAFRNLQSIVTGGCGCSFGCCTRLDANRGDHDWYEPHEARLLQDGLPWFYFIPDPQHVTDEMRDDYLRESEQLWGRNHWEAQPGTK